MTVIQQPKLRLEHYSELLVLFKLSIFKVVSFYHIVRFLLFVVQLIYIIYYYYYFLPPSLPFSSPSLPPSPPSFLMVIFLGEPQFAVM